MRLISSGIPMRLGAKKSSRSEAVGNFTQDCLQKWRPPRASGVNHESRRFHFPAVEWYGSFVVKETTDGTPDGSWPLATKLPEFHTLHLQTRNSEGSYGNNKGHGRLAHRGQDE